MISLDLVAAESVPLSVLHYVDKKACGRDLAKQCLRSKELRTKYGVRSMPVRKDDEVQVHTCKFDWYKL